MSMTAPRLNDDCIDNILRFHQNNRLTLYSCLLVNRSWCKTIIPLLYANPFADLSDNSQCLIVNTFLLCLNSEEINHLFLFKDNQKTLFQYPKYIKQMVDTKIYDAINTWYIKYKRFSRISMEATFCHMFLRQSIYIEHLEIFYSSIFNHTIFDMQLIHEFNFSKLKSLHLHSREHECFSELLQVFVKRCKNLKQLSLSRLNNSYEIESFIKQQYELKELVITYCYEFPNIFSSLKFQINSLVSLKLRSVNIHKYILQSIIKLHNLKSFEINSCYGMTLEYCEIFEFALFKLKELSIRDKFYISKIIKYLGITLQRLKFDYTNDDYINVEIMETIAQYSLDLETLDIFYLQDNIRIYALNYLKNLKIKNLNLYLTVNDNLFFISLAENLSETIKKVSFITSNIITKTNLLNFLNSCHDHIITLNFNKKFKLEQLKIILNYIKKGNSNLKYLGIKDLNKAWNIKELDILNQIREKGIELVEFSDNYKNSDYSFSD